MRLASLVRKSKARAEKGLAIGVKLYPSKPHQGAERKYWAAWFVQEEKHFR
jgi:hypothetical protein